MRVALMVTGDGLPIMGVTGGVKELRFLALDRVANGDAFNGERVVRLPRRLSRHHLISYQVVWDLARHHWPDWAFSHADPTSHTSGTGL